MTVHPVGVDDFAEWNPLWRGYLDHCQFAYHPKQAQLTWSRLLAHENALHGLLLHHDNVAVGLAHYLFHFTTTTPHPFCNLQDLYVRPAFRGRGGATMLLTAVADAARAQQADGFYWLTESHNSTARALYDRVAVRTSHVLYAMALHAPAPAPDQ